MNATIAEVNALGRKAASLDSQIAKMVIDPSALTRIEPLTSETKDLERQVGELYGERKPDLDRLRAGLLCLIATYRRVIEKVDPVDSDHERCRGCGRIIPTGFGGACAECLRKIADVSGLEPRTVIEARDAAAHRPHA